MSWNVLSGTQKIHKKWGSIVLNEWIKFIERRNLVNFGKNKKNVCSIYLIDFFLFNKFDPLFNTFDQHLFSLFCGSWEDLRGNSILWRQLIPVVTSGNDFGKDQVDSLSATSNLLLKKYCSINLFNVTDHLLYPFLKILAK